METRVKVSLAEVAKVKDFVNTVSKYDCDFDLVSDHYVIDGKSIMGIFSLNLSKPIDLDIRAISEKQASDILEDLKPFLV